MQPNDTPHICEQCGIVFKHSRPWDPGRFCGRQCYAAYRRALAEATREVRFWSYIDHSATSGCWLWTRSLAGFGYGQFCVGHNRTVYAHRYAWEIATGETLTNEDVIGHTCDTPRCARNDDKGIYVVGGIALPRRGHLFKGTDANNHADMWAKGRANTTTLLNPIGTANVKAKVNDAIVREIRRRFASGDATAQHLAVEHDIGYSTVLRIVSRKTWRHVS